MQRSRGQLATAYAPYSLFTFEGDLGACFAFPSPANRSAGDELRPNTQRMISEQIQEGERAGVKTCPCDWWRQARESTVVWPCDAFAGIAVGLTSRRDYLEPSEMRSVFGGRPNFGRGARLGVGSGTTVNRTFSALNSFSILPS